MHFRPPAEQGEHKVTCGVAVGPLPRVVEGIGAALAAAGVDCNVITSGTGAPAQSLPKACQQPGKGLQRANAAQHDFPPLNLNTQPAAAQATGASWT